MGKQVLSMTVSVAAVAMTSGSYAWVCMDLKEPLPAQGHLFGMRQFI